ncbi:MAG: dihydroneopterin aldolase [Methanobacteriota archaeon]
MDRLRLTNMSFYARVGHLPEERALGAHIEVDVELSTDLSKAGTSDRIADAVDYAAVHRAVAEVVAAKEYHLLEGLATAIAERMKAFRPHLVTVRVRKPRPPLPGNIAAAEVEIVR